VCALMTAYSFLTALCALAKPSTYTACNVLQCTYKHAATKGRKPIVSGAPMKDMVHRSSTCRWRGQGEYSFFLLQCTLTQIQDFQDGLRKLFKRCHTAICFGNA
jgi:hypothetical protein